MAEDEKPVATEDKESAVTSDLCLSYFGAVDALSQIVASLVDEHARRCADPVAAVDQVLRDAKREFAAYSDLEEGEPATHHKGGLDAIERVREGVEYRASSRAHVNSPT